MTVGDCDPRFAAPAPETCQAAEIALPSALPSGAAANFAVSPKVLQKTEEVGLTRRPKSLPSLAPNRGENS
jgi:hypothetical protein